MSPIHTDTVNAIRANMAGNSEVTLTELDLSRLSSAELTFLKEQTGISDEDALKKHINQIQNDATKASSSYSKSIFQNM